MNSHTLSPDRVYQRLFFYLLLLLSTSIGGLYLVTSGILPKPVLFNVLENKHQTYHVVDSFTNEIDLQIDEVHQAFVQHDFEYAIVNYQWIIDNYGEDKDQDAAKQQVKEFRKGLVEYVQLSEDEDLPCSPKLCEEIESILLHLYDIRERFEQTTQKNVRKIDCPICIKEMSAFIFERWFPIY